MNELEELKKQLAKKFPWLPIHGEDRIANFILSDRQRICAPIQRRFLYDTSCIGCQEMAIAMVNVIKLAGLEVK